MMAPRFSERDATQADTVQVMHEGINDMFGGKPPMQWKTDDGAVLGPFGPMLCSPLMLPEWFVLAKLTYDPRLLEPRMREIALLGLCSIHDAPFVSTTHRAIAGAMGISSTQWDQGLKGEVPAGVNDKEAMAYRLGRHLTTLTGRLDDVTWAEAVSVLGKESVVAILNVISGFKWVALLDQVNGSDGDSDHVSQT